MATKLLTCIECPVGCSLVADIEDCRVVNVTGNKCPLGQAYAVSEIDRPVRVLTSSVLSQGLDIKMVPVRTSGPIPKGRLMEAMGALKKIRLTKPVSAGDIIVSNFLGTGVDLVASREANFE